MKNRLYPWASALVSAVLLSIPWLVPHTGFLALLGFVPLLMAEDYARHTGMKRFWLCHYACFVLWNALTTFWVCNATVGGGIFAVLVNALQMSVVFGVFRLGRRHLKGAVPYILLAATWIAWERFYFSAEISWPWLVLGNAFAGTTPLVQWYEFTGSLGGSLWVWAVNLGVFGLLTALSDGSFARWNSKARATAVTALALAIVGPAVVSAVIYSNYEERSEGTVDVVIGQPNLDPYHKFESMTQAQQTDVLLGQYAKVLDTVTSPLLLLAPETFTSDVWLPAAADSPTSMRFRELLAAHPGSQILFGASSHRFTVSDLPPSDLARPWNGGWLQSYNDAIMLDEAGKAEVFHKSRLVVGTELTPWPKFFTKVDDWLCKVTDTQGPMMGRCETQSRITPLHFGDIPLGCAVCYESVYGEYCTGYVNAGARFMTVITNDAWWGDTPGYRQHFNYSRLRAIELRRDVARCGNTGISAFIDQKGDVVERGPWWEPAVLAASVNLNSEKTFFVRNGDLVGRVSTLVFLLLAALLFVKCITPKKK